MKFTFLPFTIGAMITDVTIGFLVIMYVLVIKFADVTMATFSFIITKVRNFEVIYTVCHDHESSLLWPTLTHTINTDDLYFSQTRFDAF
jgi:hypothetical protein